MMHPRTPASLVCFAASLLAGLLPLRAGAAGAVALPDPGVPGFAFPESEATVAGWVYDLGHGTAGGSAATAFEHLQTHGWGLWTALTSETAQTDAYGTRLRVFETWSTPQELAESTVAMAAAISLPGSGRRAGSRAALRRLNQFDHEAGRGGGPRPQPQASALAPALVPALVPASAPAQVPVVGAVLFDPTAAAHVLGQQLLLQATLARLLQSGAAEVPVFPPTALVLKAAYQVASAPYLVGGRYFALKVWQGPPPVSQGWAPAQWPGCVWIDLQGGGRGRGAVDAVAAPDGSSRTEATTYPVGRLMHHRLSAAEAATADAAFPNLGAAAGDVAMLVGMHVAGREIVRWTWQTYWWTPAPEAPELPSSADVAALRPQRLADPARNYAMALGYDMLTPGQPVSGGSNAGLAIYCYNPWLEAHFSPSDLPDSIAGYGPDGRPSANDTGVNSNCMSCHSRANFNPDRLPGAPRYSGARYVDPADPQFAGTLRLDFLWSLPANAL